MSGSKRNTDRAEITDETYLLLTTAAAVAEARGVAAEISTKSLRREAARGRLTTYSVFGRLHTTLGDIRQMFQACRVEPPARPASVSARDVTPGSARTDEASPAGQAALASVDRLKKRCRQRPAEDMELGALMLSAERLKKRTRGSSRARKAKP